MKKFLLLTVILLLFPIAVHAVRDIPVSDLFAQSEVSQLDEIELERQKGFEAQLNFTLPKYSDNPSYVITFTDPSPDAVGVHVDIDGKGFTPITSPYTFPALTIGEHIIKFRFNDKDGNLQTLEYTFIIIPRSPIINPPVVNEDSIDIKGTALSNSDVLLFITSNTFNQTETVKTDSNGDWSASIAPEDGLSQGIYTVTGYTRRDGYASEFAQATVFEVGEGIGNKNENDKTISFAFKDIDWGNIINTVALNPDLIILIIGTLIVGIIPTAILTSAGKKRREEYMFKSAEKSIKGDKNKDGDKTLRELFESNGTKPDDTPKKEEKQEIKINTDVSKKIKEVKNEDKIISKEDFLKEYKSADPDDDSGKEKSVKKMKKDIKVSLTSREE